MKLFPISRPALWMVAGLAFTPLLSAQDAPKGDRAAIRERLAQRQQGQAPAPGALPDAARTFYENLSQEQREALREMSESLRTSTQETNAKLLAARKLLADAAFGEKMDEAQVRTRAQEVGKLEGELAIARAKAFNQVRSKFTPEQQEQLKLAFSLPAFPQRSNLTGAPGRPGAGGATEEVRRPRPPQPDKQ